MPGMPINGGEKKQGIVIVISKSCSSCLWKTKTGPRKI